MTKLGGLLKAEYLWTPSRLVQRILGRSRARHEGGRWVVPMRWGLSLDVTELDDVVRAVDRLGVQDLVVTETIWRLLRPGDTAVDVGANVGYMSLAMAARLRRAGRVFSFEPHPRLFEELSANLARARAVYPGVELLGNNEALSDKSGVAWLAEPSGFDGNRGLATIAAKRSEEGSGHSVPIRCLDAYAETLGDVVALAKIDVEGHEPAVLRGAGGLLARGVIRHLVIEEHHGYPSESTRLLEAAGYTIFSLERTLFRPRLGHPARPERSVWEAPNLLATRDPEEVRARFAAPGWQSLGGR